MSVQYPYRKTLYLYGAAAKAEVMNYVRAFCIPEEASSLPSIVSAWAGASQRFHQIELEERGEAEKINVENLPPELAPRLKEISDDHLFKQTFSQLPFEFKLVELDRLAAGQRTVNLDYVDILKERIPRSPTDGDLIEFCLAPQKQVKLPAEQILGQNVYSFTSENVDFRFLGGFRKPLTEDDIKASTTGGYPLAAIVLLVGLGASSMNAFVYQHRYVLNNGFHRAFALRAVGVKQVPIVVQSVNNPQLEFPQVVAELPREYLLGANRPALMKDFFDSELTKELKAKAQNKIVQVQWNASQFIIPIAG